MPTIAGVLTNEFFPGIVKKLKSVLPLIGVALTTLLCASPCAQVATILRCGFHRHCTVPGHFACSGVNTGIGYISFDMRLHGRQPGLL